MICTDKIVSNSNSIFAGSAGFSLSGSQFSYVTLRMNIIYSNTSLIDHELALPLPTFPEGKVCMYSTSRKSLNKRLTSGRFEVVSAHTPDAVCIAFVCIRLRASVFVCVRLCTSACVCIRLHASVCVCVDVRVRLRAFHHKVELSTVFILGQMQAIDTQ